MASVGTAVAHEIGHIFGMNHDDAASKYKGDYDGYLWCHDYFVGCNCPNAQDGCIMNALIG